MRDRKCLSIALVPLRSRGRGVYAAPPTIGYRDDTIVHPPQKVCMYVRRTSSKSEVQAEVVYPET